MPAQPHTVVLALQGSGTKHRSVSAPRHAAQRFFTVLILPALLSVLVGVATIAKFQSHQWAASLSTTSTARPRLKRPPLRGPVKGKPRAPAKGKAAATAAHVQNSRIALLLDGDQVSQDAVEAILEELCMRGTVPVRRFYGFKNHLQEKEAELQRFNITPVPVRRNLGSNKETVDMRICLDSALIAANPSLASRYFGVDVEGISAIAVASDDFDFLDLFAQLHELRGVHADVPVGFLMRRESITRPGIRQKAVKLGAELIAYTPGAKKGRSESLEEKKYGCVNMVMEKGKDTIFEALHTDYAPRKYPDEHKAEVKVTLFELGYTKWETPFRPNEGAVFFHANDLGRYIVYPDAVAYEQVMAIFEKFPDRKWIRNPGNLVFIAPVGGQEYNMKLDGQLLSTDQTVYVKGGGAFILEDSPHLVRDVLTKLGYLETEEAWEYEAAVSLFWDLNYANLANQGVPRHMLQITAHDRRESLLRNAFTSMLGRQQWRIPIEDKTARMMLLREGLLRNRTASSQEAGAAVWRYLRGERAVQPGEEQPRYYPALVHRFMEFQKKAKGMKARF